MTAGTPDCTRAEESWVPHLYRLAGLADDAPLAEVQEKMSGLANAAAPVARGWSAVVIVIQGACVAAPLLWLLRRPLGLTPAAAALVTFAAAVLLVAALWWMRWRGTQRTWARARLLAEIARGQQAAALCPAPLHPALLDAVPGVRGLLAPADPSAIKPWPEWRDGWVAARVDGQLKYFREAREKAERERRRLNRWVTHLMDATLALAIAGLIVALSDRGPEWLRVLGDRWIEIVAGVLGVLLPLGVILLQSFRSLRELNRRAALFARQIRLLEKAREEILLAAEPAAALKLAEETEALLLGEVVDWYFEAETAEQFFQVRERGEENGSRPHAPGGRPARPARSMRPIFWGLASMSVFLVASRILLGRLPWVLGAFAATLAWLSYNSPSSPEARSRLRFDAALVDENGRPWEIAPESRSRGCVIIAHGLHDGVTLADRKTGHRWMKSLTEAMRARLGAAAPNIGLVDWSAAANPTVIHALHPGVDSAKFLGDVAGIRPQAYEIGDALAFRLAQLIAEEKIDRRAPLHFVGHSAGGFVVARAAIVLRRLNLAPENMLVTILDTPAPDAEILEQLPRLCPVDYYVTSGFVLGLDEQNPPPGIRVRFIKPRPDFTMLQAHSYAHEWFIETASRAAPRGEGFGRSPFVAGPGTP